MEAENCKKNMKVIAEAKRKEELFVLKHEKTGKIYNDARTVINEHYEHFNEMEVIWGFLIQDINELEIDVTNKYGDEDTVNITDEFVPVFNKELLEQYETF
jgi:hypothetical protein